MMTLFAIVLAATFHCSPQQAAPTPQSDSDYCICGRVMNSVTGEPISQAQVVLSPQFRGLQPQVLFTEESGIFAFRNLPAGRYTVVASRRGYTTQSYLQHAAYFSAVLVGEGFDTSHVDLKLPPQAVITGHVFSDTGEPIRNAQVTIFFRDDASGAQGQNVRGAAQTDDEGRYRVPRLQPGTYFVGASAQPWYARHQQTMWPAKNERNEGGESFRVQLPPGSIDARLDVAYQMTFYGGGTQAGSAQPIRLSAGETQNADIVLTAVPARHVRLTMPSDMVGGPDINLQNAAAPFMDGVQVQTYRVEPGVWELAGIPPGQFTGTLRTSGGENQSEQVQRVELGDSAVLNVQAGSTGVNVKGVLTGESGFRPGGSQVVLRMMRAEQFNARVEQDGSFEFLQKLPAGKYSMVINGGTPHYLTKLTATGAQVSGRTMEIGAQDVQMSVSVSGSFSNVSGFALRDAKHTVGMLVVILPQGETKDAFPIRFDQSNADGSYAFNNLVPGKYLLFALDNAWDLDWENPNFLAQFSSKAQAIVAEAGQMSSIDVSAMDARAGVVKK